jgi:hypothetical protein
MADKFDYSDIIDGERIQKPITPSGKAERRRTSQRENREMTALSMRSPQAKRRAARRAAITKAMRDKQKGLIPASPTK